MYVVPRLPRRRPRRPAARRAARGRRASAAAGATRLDTSAYLTAAVALYRSAGYTEVADYNGNVKADLWFERAALTSRSGSLPLRPGLARGLRARAVGARGGDRRLGDGGVHHVGSTAVPGLAAKPIVDILVGVEEPRELAGMLRRPFSAGLEYRVRRPIAARRCTGSASRIRAGATHHLHLAPTGRRVATPSELAFRDRLRADPETAAALRAR